MKELPLTNIEIKLKNGYKTNPELKNCAFNLKEISEYLDAVFESDGMNSTIFHEDSFILSGLDCAFVRHLRYLPAFYHSHDFFEIVYVQRGSCVNYIGDDVLEMKSGDFCFHSPGIVHAIRAFSDEDIVYNIVIRQSTFEQYFLGLFSEADILSLFFHHVIYHNEEFPYLLFHAGNDNELSEVISKAGQEYDLNNRFKKQYLNAILAEFFAILLRNHEKDVYIPASSQGGASGNIVFIIHYMEEHYDTVSLKELADFFGYSERQIQRLIKKATGKTFMENIQYHRVKRAEELLKNSNMSIEKIAINVGYSSCNNFRRVFEKVNGLMPNEYRTKYLAEHGGDNNWM